MSEFNNLSQSHFDSIILECGNKPSKVCVCGKCVNQKCFSCQQCQNCNQNWKNNHNHYPNILPPKTMDVVSFEQFKQSIIFNTNIGMDKYFLNKIKTRIDLLKMQLDIAFQKYKDITQSSNKKWNLQGKRIINLISDTRTQQLTGRDCCKIIFAQGILQKLSQQNNAVEKKKQFLHQLMMKKMDAFQFIPLETKIGNFKELSQQYLNKACNITQDQDQNYKNAKKSQFYNIENSQTALVIGYYNARLNNGNIEYYYKKALQLGLNEQNQAICNYNLSLCSYRHNAYEEGLNYINFALSIKHDKLIYHYQKAFLLYLLKNYNQSIKYIKNMVQLNSQNPIVTQYAIRNQIMSRIQILAQIHSKCYQMIQQNIKSNTQQGQFKWRHILWTHGPQDWAIMNRHLLPNSINLIN